MRTNVVWINAFLEEVGYQLSLEMEVYRCLPTKTVVESLIALKGDDDALKMIHVAQRMKRLTLQFLMLI